MPGLLRGMARTAVVAGTATAVSNRVSRRQANTLGASRTRYAAGEQYAAAAAAPAPRGRPRPSRIEQLKDLADLKEQGVLTEEEFASEKARILAS